MKIDIDQFISGFSLKFQDLALLQPWEITDRLKNWLEEIISELDDNFIVADNVAVHRTARIESSAVINKPAIIGPNCTVCANAYLREGVYLDQKVKIGPGCEIKTSIICAETAIAHFNYIGNSIIGSQVNFEAGSIAANHYNERNSKEISVLFQSSIIKTNALKFGSLVGDGSKIGANAVLSPGTLLSSGSIVGRLQLVEQISEE